MDEKRKEREWHLLRNPSVMLANGILLFDEDQPSECGRLVFWLGELPLYTLFATELGTTLERLKNNKVRVRYPHSKEEKLLDVPAKPRELSSSLSASRHTRSVSEGSTFAAVSSHSSFSSTPSSSSSSSFITYSAEVKPKTSWWSRFSSSSSSSSTPTTTTRPKSITTEASTDRLADEPHGKDWSTPRKKAADSITKLAENDRMQEKSGQFVAQLAQDKRVQSMVGDAFAESADNSFMARLAKNPKVQEKIASKVSAAATNKKVQKKVGQMVSDFAHNEEAQKQAVGFMGSLLKAATAPRS